MKAIREVDEQHLRWTQPGTFTRDYELRAGDEVLATLRWQKALALLPWRRRPAARGPLSAPDFSAQ
jgi:hypothetical protein